MKRINIDFKVEKNGKLVKVQSEESVPTKTSELENDSGFITQAPETAVDNQTITKNSANEIQAIGVKYNDNLITAEMIYNATHYIRYKEDEPTPPIPTGEAGLYVDGVLSKSWAQLLSDRDVTITNGALKVANRDLAGDLVCDNVEGLANLQEAFMGCGGLTDIDTSKLDTSNVTSMYQMFSNCFNLTSLDVSNFNTSNVTNMSGMFDACFHLTDLYLDNFNTSNVTDMTAMFGTCSSLIGLDVYNFNTSKVTSMTGMFNNCKDLDWLDLSSFDTSNVINMYDMFYNCSSLTNLDISNFTFDKVTNYGHMFEAVPNNCEILVKSQTEKDWITSKFTNLTNVKIKGAV